METDRQKERGKKKNITEWLGHGSKQLETVYAELPNNKMAGEEAKQNLLAL